METHAFPDSSNVRTASYDQDTGDLVVTFAHGKTYTYPNTTPSTWRAFKTAESPGRFVSRTLR